MKYAKENDFDWDPRSDDVLKDQIAVYDEMRQKCPIARSAYGYTSIFRHADVMNIMNDHETFSSKVSRFISVPNGMDPPEHTVYRNLINPYFTDAQVDKFVPKLEKISNNLVKTLPKDDVIEFMSQFAQVFAVHVQCAFLGWSKGLHQPLLDWIKDSYQATLSRDQDRLNTVAMQFDSYIKDIIYTRRNRKPTPNSDNAQDNTDKLINETVDGKALTDDQIVSILRNWTVGELGTISASVGILAHYFASNPDVQKLCRNDYDVLPAAIDEILRIHPPLIMNRRVTTCPVTIGKHPIEQGERLAILWASANRDEAVFGNPDEFRLDRDPSLNLLYGAGVHVCPGAYLSRMELLIITKALLSATTDIRLPKNQPYEKAHLPSSGFSKLPLHIIT